MSRPLPALVPPLMVSPGARLLRYIGQSQASATRALAVSYLEHTPVVSSEAPHSPGREARRPVLRGTANWPPMWD